jgi:hypothetical protein
VQVFHGASRTRTGDLLGAIHPLFGARTGLFAALFGERLDCRNISRNNSAVVLHSDNEYPVPSLRANTTAGAPAYSCGRSAWLFSNAWVTAAS